jgi:hypothetical protein
MFAHSLGEVLQIQNRNGERMGGNWIASTFERIVGVRSENSGDKHEGKEFKNSLKCN